MVLEVCEDILRAEGSPDGGGEIFRPALGELDPLFVEIGIAQLQVRGIQADRVGVVRIVEDEPGEVVPVGLENRAPAGVWVSSQAEAAW